MVARKWAGVAVLLASLGLPLFGGAAESDPVTRGARALQERALNPPAWTARAYPNAWRAWGTKTDRPPVNYAEAFRERYGLHTAPFANGEYPMGLRPSQFLLTRGITTDCLLCHGGAIAGRSYIGLGNSTLDLQALFEELAAADGRSPRLPFTFSNVRGTSEAGAVSVYLLGWRELDLKMRSKHLNLDLRDDLCEDVPAWWLLKKKKTMYFTGAGDARSVRSLMQFMMSPLTASSTFAREEAAFADIRQFILSLTPPKYPFPIDHALAQKGELLFRANCARCHGTYGEHWTYPNKIVPLEEIGTDPNRFYGISEKFVNYFNQSWFGREKDGWLGHDYSARVTRGYQAPPLDGVWATAPYFHNGSVPTVYHVLNSKPRPRIFTRSYRTAEEDYDPVRLGWKVDILQHAPSHELPAIERRKVYDTHKPGRSNSGHTFGDELSDSERMAVIEYLKTL